jgi:biotin operon repressor
MKYKIKDKSNDRAYFTIIPNFILNHSSATAQALYLQLKRLSGEAGIAFPSQTYLMKKLGISKNKLKKEITYLLERGWIVYIGKKKTKTAGGRQYVKSYKIVDIWQQNSKYYFEKQRGVKIDLPNQRGVKIDHKGGQNRPQRGVKIDPLIRTSIKKNHINKNQQEAKASSIKRISDVLDKFKLPTEQARGATYQWQDTAVRWWVKLDLEEKPTASWFKIFRDNTSLAERACSWASDSGGDELEKLTYWAFNQFKKNGKIVYEK